MKYEVFSKLWNEAAEYDSEEMFISERGWQEWMDRYGDADKIALILKTIYHYANSGIREIREDHKLSVPKFSALFSISRRTVQDWEYGNNRTPEYVKKLVAYALMENIL